MKSKARIALSEDQKQVLWHLRSKGPASRSDLALRLDASNTALTKITRELLALDLVEELDLDADRMRGRPAIPLTISARGGYAVGAAVHRGLLEVTLLDYAGAPISAATEAFNSAEPRVFADALLRILHRLTAEKSLLTRRLLGVGIGVPGAAISRDGTRRWTVAGLEGWRDVPLDEVIGDYLGLPVWIENDANAAALGEYYAGGLIGQYSTVVVILLGHGIGAGVIAAGELLKGEMGNAGDIGRLYPGNRPRPSGVDLLATLASAGCDISSLADLKQQTSKHAEVIESWIERAAAQLEPMIDGSIAWFDPGMIVLSSSLPESMLQQLEGRLRSAQLMRPPVRIAPPELRSSELGGAAVSIGAALLPIHALTAPGQLFSKK
jgi:predicted NBD/HSP70 family sugar kinase